MTLIRRVGALAFIVVLGVSVPVLAEQSGPGVIKQDDGTSSTQPRRKRGQARMEMQQKLHEMQAHSRMMEGITDQQQLIREMKTHMRMGDAMIERMMMMLQLHREPSVADHEGHDADLHQKLMQYYQRMAPPQQRSEAPDHDSDTGRSVAPQPTTQESHP